MIAKLSDVSPEVLAIAAERLQTVGVFADESNQFPNSFDAQEFEQSVRENGYTGGKLEIGELDQTRNGVNTLIFDTGKLSHTDDAALAWENDYKTRWHKRVEDRVADWLNRLRDLQTTMQGWLPVNMDIVQRQPIIMHEELMAKFNVPPKEMPSFDIINQNQPVMRVQPKGLYIVGANGRVDLITRNGSYILVDAATALSRPVKWQYFDSKHKRLPTALNASTFSSLLQ